jgi:cytidylate kinase
MKHPIIIAIDGFSSCGKSTLARDISKELGYMYIDSGAMYRAVTYYFLKNNIDLNQAAAVQSAVEKIHLHFEHNKGKSEIYLSGGNIESKIRTAEISERVSDIAALSPVRRKLVSLQREFAAGQSVVMDGRDIGTVVFPNATVKLFITADLNVRTQRRFKELRDRGVNISKKDVEKNLQHRDHIDSTRDDSPLRKADDAILIDNSKMNQSEQLQLALQLIREKKS